MLLLAGTLRLDDGHLLRLVLAAAAALTVRVAIVREAIVRGRLEVVVHEVVVKVRGHQRILMVAVLITAPARIRILVG